jgi:hypothetical protein
MHPKKTKTKTQDGYILSWYNFGKIRGSISCDVTEGRPALALASWQESFRLRGQGRVGIPKSFSKAFYQIKRLFTALDLCPMNKLRVLLSVQCFVITRELTSRKPLINAAVSWTDVSSLSRHIWMLLMSSVLISTLKLLFWIITHSGT